LKNLLLYAGLGLALSIVPAVWSASNYPLAEADQDIPSDDSWSQPDPGDPDVIPVIYPRVRNLDSELDGYLDSRGYIDLGVGAAPYDVAIYRGTDPKGNLPGFVSKMYVTDSANNGVLVFDVDLPGVTKPNVNFLVVKGRPSGIAADEIAGHIYVLEEMGDVDEGTNYSQVGVYDLLWNFQMHLRPQRVNPGPGGGKIPLQGLTGIDVDASGRVYVTGAQSRGVHVFEPGLFTGSTAEVATEVWGNGVSDDYLTYWVDVSVDEDDRIHGVGMVAQVAEPSPKWVGDMGIIDRATGMWSTRNLGSTADDMGVDASFRYPKSGGLEVASAVTNSIHARLYSTDSGGYTIPWAALSSPMLDTPIGLESAVFDNYDYVDPEDPVRWVFICSSGNEKVFVFEAP